MINILGNRGLIENTQKFKKIKGKDFENFYELIIKRFRIFALYFEQKRELVLLIGLKKQKQKLPKGTYKRIYKKYKEVLV